MLIQLPTFFELFLHPDLFKTSQYEDIEENNWGEWEFIAKTPKVELVQK